jgi:hypothetical protein
MDRRRHLVVMGRPQYGPLTIGAELSEKIVRQTRVFLAIVECIIFGSNDVTSFRGREKWDYSV